MLMLSQAREVRGKKNQRKVGINLLRILSKL
jgi:hypothetical protein